MAIVLETSPLMELNANNMKELLFTSLFNNAPKGQKATYTKILPLEYDDVAEEIEMVKFYRETRHIDGPSWDDPLPYGFIKSVWHELYINNVKVPVYSTRCGFGIHSFAVLDVVTDGELSLKVKVKILEGNYSQSLVLPEKRGVKTTLKDNEVTFEIKEYGDYSLCFGNEEIGPDKALTIYVSPHREIKDVPGYNKIVIKPRDFSEIPAKSLDFSEKHTFYYIEKGRYKVNSISVPDDSILYFENGCYLEYFEEDDKPCFYNLGSSMYILGHVLLDFSHIMGGYKKKKGCYNFKQLNQGYIEGQLCINSHTWTMCFHECDDVEIANNMLLGYRTFSDGIMLAGCTNCLTHYNFVRSGDDAIEAKATSSRVVKSNNLVYEYNSVWTDKANAYGVIYESNAPVTDVYFRHNSVGFAQSCWAHHLASFTIQRGTNFEHVWSNIHFEDSEVYYSNNPLMTIFNSTVNIFDYGDPLARLYGGRIKDIYFKNLTLKRQERNDLPITFSLNLEYRLNKDFPDYIKHLELGDIYLDNINYLGNIITKDNLLQSAFISVPEGIGWTLDNIKINTLGKE